MNQEQFARAFSHSWHAIASVRLTPVQRSKAGAIPGKQLIRLRMDKVEAGH
jgi:hypothetical protein